MAATISEETMLWTDAEDDRLVSLLKDQGFTMHAAANLMKRTPSAVANRWTHLRTVRNLDALSTGRRGNGGEMPTERAKRARKPGSKKSGRKPGRPRRTVPQPEPATEPAAPAFQIAPQAPKARPIGVPPKEDMFRIVFQVGGIDAVVVKLDGAAWARAMATAVAEA